MKQPINTLSAILNELKKFCKKYDLTFYCAGKNTISIGFYPSIYSEQLFYIEYVRSDEFIFRKCARHGEWVLRTKPLIAKLNKLLSPIAIAVSCDDIQRATSNGR